VGLGKRLGGPGSGHEYVREHRRLFLGRDCRLHYVGGLARGFTGSGEEHHHRHHADVVRQFDRVAGQAYEHQSGESAGLLRHRPATTGTRAARTLCQRCPGGHRQRNGYRQD